MTTPQFKTFYAKNEPAKFRRGQYVAYDYDDGKFRVIDYRHDLNGAIRYYITDTPKKGPQVSGCQYLTGVRQKDLTKWVKK